MKYNKKKINSINGEDIYSITFINDNNFKITFYTYGGYIHNVIIPYKNNPDKFEDVILGYDDFNQCLEAPGYFNSIIGRVGNRISNSKFVLNNNTYTLFNNAGDDHLHGGKEGFNKKVWSIKNLIRNNNELICELGYLSKNLDEGYPGNLDCRVIYTLNNDNEFTIVEVECLGACCNAPMIQINDHYYEDLDESNFREILINLKNKKTIKTGSQIGRQSSNPKRDN